MKRSIAQIAALGAIMLTLLGLFYVFYLAFEPFKIPTITPRLIPILNQNHQIVQGGILSTDLNFCIFKQVPTTSTRRLEEIKTGRVYLFTTAVSSPKKGCNHIVVQANLPGDIPPGYYKITTTSTYVINPLKTVVANFTSEEFEITSRP